MAEIEKEAVGFPVTCHPVAGEFTYVAAPYFFNLFTLFSSIKNLAGLLGCSCPSNKQIVLYHILETLS